MTDNSLIAALALAVTKKPRANLQQIAAMAGISKATLYRITPTREQLLEMLYKKAETHIRNSLTDADLYSKHYKEALNCLIKNILAEKELYLFWVSALWIDLGASKEIHLGGYNHSFLTQELELFFKEGQRKGLFCIDMPATWLAKSCDYLIYAAAESTQRGEIGSLSAPDFVEKMFLNGASAI